MKQTILAIETSCDETGIAIVEARGGLKNPSFHVVKNALTSSQTKIHTLYGGVVPNLAKREHIKNLPIIYKRLVGLPGSAAEKKIWKSIDTIAVTVGPGLEPALWTGITFAQELSKKWKKSLVGAHHMQGHLYSMLLDRTAKVPPLQFPAVALIVSGGHTMLLLLKDLASWKNLGETRDDAVGEAFDKVARMLKLPYPGGPEIQRLAALGNPAAVPFPRPMVNDRNYEFSFSGLKTSVLYYCRDNPKTKTADVAASFQAAAIDVLAIKTFRAVEAFGAKGVMLGGGVAANKALRMRLAQDAKKRGVQFSVPKMKYNTDNPAMIGAAAYMQLLRKKKNPLKANGRLGM